MSTKTITDEVRKDRKELRRALAGLLYLVDALEDGVDDKLYDRAIDRAESALKKSMGAQ